MRGRGEPFQCAGAGTDKSWFFDMVSIGKCDVVTIRLMGMDDLAEGRERDCPITGDTFDKSCIDCVPEGTALFLDRPNLCVAEMPCGHAFGVLPLLYHAVVGDMRCPVCRFGIERRMRPSCVPEHIRAQLSDQLERIKNEVSCFDKVYSQRTCSHRRAGAARRGRANAKHRALDSLRGIFRGN